MPRITPVAAEVSLTERPGALKEAGVQTCLVVPTLAVPGLAGGYTYAVPETLEIEPGSLVLIDLHGALRKGIVMELGTPAPEGVPLKSVLAVHPGGPMMTQAQLTLAQWIARYYRSSLFTALRLCFWDLKFFQASIGYRLIDPDRAMDLLNGKGLRLQGDPDALAAIRGEVLKGKELKRLWTALDLHGKEADKALPMLLEGGAIAPDYELKSAARRAVEPAYRPASEPDLDTLTAKEKALWKALLNFAPPWHYEELAKRFPGNRTPWNGLVKKGILEPVAQRGKAGGGSTHILTLKQQDALHAITETLGTGVPAVHLLQGVTGSGKTEVYLRTAEAALEHGAVLILVPEIALTHQMVERVTRFFGARRVGLLHSAQTDRERRAVWEGIRAGHLDVLVGPRSALFAPASKISLIILDEEHEGAYKQQASPRYHARVVAQKLIELHGATLLLGSATPSLEAYLGAQRREVGYHVLPERASAGSLLPTVEIVPLHKSAMRGDEPTITGPLGALMAETLERGRQSLLFLNQRGFAQCLRCPDCGFIPRCPRCDIALTYHQRGRKLACHHCDYSQAPPQECPQCASPELGVLGFGTEQVEGLVKTLFPAARVERLDRDITNLHRGALEGTLDRFSRGEVDVLVGTQMVAKGLDIPGLAAVGVILADLGLTLPDFRAAERTFQLLTQVAGRAGRREEPGRVIIQTFQPDHPVIHLATQQDYVTFAQGELRLRQLLHYPPYCRLVRVLFEDPDPKSAQGAAADFAAFCHHAIGDRALAEPEARVEVLGPAPAALARLQGRFR
ncbi:MAG TPA: primosomal protein N', partial [bacterium]|nr:primosomal protein N' [bacterium]